MMNAWWIAYICFGFGLALFGFIVHFCKSSDAKEPPTFQEFKEEYLKKHP